MMHRALCTAICGVIAVLLAVGLVLFARSDPSTAELDRDIAAIRAELDSAAKEGEKYSSGLIKSLIDVRVETLRTNEAMLLAKKASFLRRIDLLYIVNGRASERVSEAGLKNMQEDIFEVRKRVAEAELKAQAYTGGLAQAMALATTETERLALAQLYLAYYSYKYGIFTSNLGSPASTGDLNPVPPGNIVKEKDAL